MVELKEAVRNAKDFVKDAFSSENVQSIRLEEIVFNELDDSWTVTIGILRPENEKLKGLSAAFADTPLKRTYKVVTVKDDGRVVPSIKMREVVS